MERGFTDCIAKLTESKRGSYEAKLLIGVLSLFGAIAGTVFPVTIPVIAKTLVLAYVAYNSDNTKYSHAP